MAFRQGTTPVFANDSDLCRKRSGQRYATMIYAPALDGGEARISQALILGNLGAKRVCCQRNLCFDSAAPKPKPAQ